MIKERNFHWFKKPRHGTANEPQRSSLTISFTTKDKKKIKHFLVDGNKLVRNC